MTAVTPVGVLKAVTEAVAVLDKQLARRAEVALEDTKQKLRNQELELVKLREVVQQVRKELTGARSLYRKWKGKAEKLEAELDGRTLLRAGASVEVLTHVRSHRGGTVERVRPAKILKHNVQLKQYQVRYTDDLPGEPILEDVCATRVGRGQQ